MYRGGSWPCSTAGRPTRRRSACSWPPADASAGPSGSPRDRRRPTTPAEPFWRRRRLGRVCRTSRPCRVGVRRPRPSWSAALIILALEPRRDRVEFDLVLPFAAYSALLQGSFGVGDGHRQHDPRQRDAADPRRPVGRRSASRPACSTSAAQGQFLHRAPSPRPRSAPRWPTSPPLDRDPAGARGRACWPARPGASSPAPSRRVTGAHEVVTTIMLNSIAVAPRSRCVILGPLLAPGFSFARSPATSATPCCPIIFGDATSTSGVLLALAAVPLIWWLLYRTHPRVRDPHASAPTRTRRAMPACGRVA